jgi:transcriptional regulator CtsR
MMTIVLLGIELAISTDKEGNIIQPAVDRSIITQAEQELLLYLNYEPVIITQS